MQPANLPLELYRGDTYRTTLKLWQDAAGTQPIDLLGVIAKAEIRDRPAGATVIPLTCVVTLPNIVDIVLAAADARNLPVTGVWDLQLTYASGDVKTPVAGPVTVTADVTDST